MPELSVLIPSRNEMFLNYTVADVLAKARGDTEVIVIADGPWPDPPLQDHPKLTVVHHEPKGQRGATNEGARISQAKYIMKLDAHCCVDEGFDVKLMQDCQPDWTMVPAMYNMHAFNWRCKACSNETYQGAQPDKCEKCGAIDFEIVIVWKPRWNRLTLTWRFDNNLQFQYWRGHVKRPEVQAQGDLMETMSFIGACMFLERKRFWELGGMDEAHGSWGQFGTEWACKTWLSGGKLITSKKTWFAHMFRTGNFAQGGHSTFPYPLSQQAVDRARAYSRDLWLNNKWPGAKYPLSWLIEKFAPVPDWEQGAT